MAEHDFPLQVTALNAPLLPHVVHALPVKPVLQETHVLLPVVPEIDPAAALFELATCVAVHALAPQVTALNAPFEPQVVQALPV